MPERIADLRNDLITMDDARRNFDALARDVLRLAALDAAFEKRMATEKARHEANTEILRAAITLGGESLARFIEQHKDLFQDPRKVKTSMGSFGLQTVTELVVDNPVRMERHLVENKIEDCFELAFRVIKTAVRKRLEAGEKLPGARIVSGDTAVYKVDKVLIDEARDRAIL